jgi:hypothetical protein
MKAPEAYPLGYVEDAYEARTTLVDFFNSLLVCGAGGGWAKPGCVLEDALRAGVVNELLAPDETLLHLKPTPGAKAIRKVGWGWRVRYRWGDMIHEGILSDR